MPGEPKRGRALHGAACGAVIGLAAGLALAASHAAFPAGGPAPAFCGPWATAATCAGLCLFAAVIGALVPGCRDPDPDAPYCCSSCGILAREKRVAGWTDGDENARWVCENCGADWVRKSVRRPTPPAP